MDYWRFSAFVTVFVSKVVAAASRGVMIHNIKLVPLTPPVSYRSLFSFCT